ncbi:MAG: DoxX family membrane protein [Actinomycetia bacterium]|nr:DoxX family membrane protein [Actinomycetes bacterium]
MPLISSIVLGAVFTFSGALKLRDPGWPLAARSLGTPDWAIPLVAPFELVLGVSLIAGLGVVVGAAAAIVLLLGFTVVLGRAIRLPNPPVCACFGHWSAKPVGVGSLARNAALIVLASIALISNL